MRLVHVSVTDWGECERNTGPIVWKRPFLNSYLRHVYLKEWKLAYRDISFSFTTAGIFLFMCFRVGSITRHIAVYLQHCCIQHTHTHMEHYIWDNSMRKNGKHFYGNVKNDIPLRT